MQVHPNNPKSPAFAFQTALWLVYRIQTACEAAQVDQKTCLSLCIFAPKMVGGHNLGQFVTKPFKSRGKILQKASVHGTKNYHLSSMTRMTEFLARYENPL